LLACVQIDRAITCVNVTPKTEKSNVSLWSNVGFFSAMMPASTNSEIPYSSIPMLGSIPK
jgi:hypothetical protein